MNYVKHVESNVKGGVNADLGARTLIVGPNGSGKSAITAAVELALTGAVSDVVGRETVKAVNELLTLGPGDSIFARATLADGGVLGHETKGKKLVPSATGTGGVSARLPLREIREVLAGGVERVRRYFLSLAAGGVTLADVKAQIPGPFHDLFDLAVSGTPTAMPAVDVLLAALDKAKATLRDLRAEVKAGAAVTSEVASGRPPLPSESDLAAARVYLKEARAVATKAATDGVNRRRHAEAQAALAEATATLHAARLASAESTGASPGPVDVVREHLIGVLQFAAGQVLDACPACKHSVSSEPQAHNEFWAERVATVTAAHAKRRALFGESARLAANLANAEAAHAEASADLARVAAGLDMSVPPPDEAALQEAAAVAEQTVIRLERAAAQHEMARRARDVAASREMQAGRWALLVEKLQGAIGLLLDANVFAFTARVQRFLPPGDVFSLALRDGDREVCRYGFVRGVPGAPETTPGRLDTALSGAEWARLCTALACAALPDSFDGLAVVIPEDRSWDRATLSLVLNALAVAPCQIILATTTEPLSVPPGWEVVRTGVQSAQAATATTLRSPIPAGGSEIVAGTCAHGVTAGGICMECAKPKAKRSYRRGAASAPPAPAPASDPAAPAAASTAAPGAFKTPVELE